MGNDGDWDASHSTKLWSISCVRNYEQKNVQPHKGRVGKDINEGKMA